jgi:hypothetical protein
MKTCKQCKYFDASGMWTACTYEAETDVEATDKACDAFELDPHFVLDADENPNDEPSTTPEIAQDAIYEFLDSWFDLAQACEILDKCRNDFESRMLVELIGEADDDEHEAQLHAA